MPVLAAVAERLLDRLDDTTRRFHRALEIGGRGAVAPRLIERGIGFVVSADLAPAMAARAGGLPVAADEEALPFAAGAFDLVVACGSLHWVNDLPGTLLQIRHILAPDGLFLGAMPCLPTLSPLRAAGRRRMPSVAAPRRESRLSPISPTGRRCCSALASPCRWQIASVSTSSTAIRWRCWPICAPPGSNRRLRRAIRARRRGRCSPVPSLGPADALPPRA